MNASGIDTLHVDEMAVTRDGEASRGDGIEPRDWIDDGHACRRRVRRRRGNRASSTPR